MQYALDLRDIQPVSGPDGVCVLYHYTNELAFCNVANLEQETAELFASLGLLTGRASPLWKGGLLHSTRASCRGLPDTNSAEQLQQYYIAVVVEQNTCPGYESTARHNRCRVSASREGMEQWQFLRASG